MDVVLARCAELRKYLRRRATLPLNRDGSVMTVEDVQSGMGLPSYSCPFSNQGTAACIFHTCDRTLFLHHIAGGIRDMTHAGLIREVCKTDFPWITSLDYVQEAMSAAEREGWPRVGLATTRRALNVLASRYIDDKIQCLVCFICGQLRTTCAGYPTIDLEADISSEGGRHTEIMYHALEAM